MTISSDQLGAYVDGQSDAEEAQRIEQAAANDPDLTRRIAGERALRERLRGHFAPVIAEPIPDAWEAMIRAAAAAEQNSGAAVIDLAEARARRGGSVPPNDRRWGRRAWAGAAIAASMVLGLIMGMQLQGGGPVGLRDGALRAQGTLARALDTQLASSQGSPRYRIMLTFRGTDGMVCRAFSGRDASGVACRAEDGWQLRHLLPGISPATSQYRQASSDNGELMAIAQGMASGDAFDARQEGAARARGWR